MSKKIRTSIVLIITVAMIMTGCSGKQNDPTADSNITTDNKAAADTSEQEASSGGNSDAKNSANDTGEAVVTYASSQVITNTEFTAKDLEVGYEDSTATHISLNNSSIDITGNGAEASDGVLTISREGTYVLTGTLTNGQIIVDAGEKEKVHLIFNGIAVTCSDNAPVYIKTADKVFITLAKDTENTLSDGSNYVLEDEVNVDGVIFSKADLTLNGDGTLNINGNYKHGIVSKDDLVITGGTYNITAVKDALNGKDCVKIKDGILNLTAATGNGIQSKNEDDSTKGYVYIAGGSITISKCKEGIEGTVITIADGVIIITAEDDGLNAASAGSSTGQFPTPGADTQDSDTETDETGTAVISLSTAGLTSDAADATSGATQNTGGAAAPDGFTPPDGATVPDGFTPPDGTARDGAAPFGPGNGNFNRGGFGGGGGAFENDTNCFISITGGTIKVNAKGDGIDSNGSLAITGGNITVSGPTDSGNGALDYNGTADITGGTAIITGSLGMAQGFSASSTQYSLSYGLSTVSAAGTGLTLTDPDGQVIIAYTPDKEYQSIVISSPELKKDVTYTLKSGDQTAEITLSDIITSGGQQGGGFGDRGRKGQNGMQRPSR